MLLTELIKDVFVSAIVLAIIAFIIKLAIYILIIRAICKYMAKQNSKSFDYDYLAERTAEEICRRMMLIEKQKNNKIMGTQTEETSENQLKSMRNSRELLKKGLF